MKKNSFRIILLCMLAAAMVFTLGACKKEETVENPKHETDYEGLLDVGINMPAPAGATDVEYAYYKVEGQPIMGEMEFELNDNEYCMRCVSTELTSIDIRKEDQSKLDAKKLKEKFGDISGMEYEWGTISVADVQNRNGYCAVTNDGVGIIVWLDVVPGFLYSLSAEEDATAALLTQVANSAFYPMQGDVQN